MKYYAKTNTADPKTGFITKGEYLTDQQAEALGEEKLRDMVERGVLGAIGESPRATVPPTEPPIEPKAEEPEEPEEPASDDIDGNDGDGDELPELSAGDVIVDETPAKPKRGGRKGK